jgi:hypothetical protein
LLNKPEQKIPVRVQLAAPGLSLFVGRSIIGLANATHPYDGRRWTYPEMRSRTPNRLARQRGIDNAITQILAVSTGHGMPPSQSREKNRTAPHDWESLLNRKTTNALVL